MIRTRKKDPAAEARPPQADSSGVPDDLAAAAGQARQQAEAARERAATLRADAQADQDEEDRQIAGIRAAGRSRRLALVADATAGDREAARLEEHGRLLARADDRQAEAAGARRLAAALTEERGGLAERIAGLDARLGQVRTGQEAAAGQLAQALDAADLDAITEARSRADSAEAAVTALTASRDEAMQRHDAIWDGYEGGELPAALRAADAHEAEARRTLNLAFPGRPEAVHDAAVDELQAALAGNLDRIADEQHAAQQAQRQTVIRH